MYKQREKIIVLFSLLLLLGGVIPGQAQKDNRFEVSKNLDIFNALVKEVEIRSTSRKRCVGVSMPC